MNGFTETTRNELIERYGSLLEAMAEVQHAMTGYAKDPCACIALDMRWAAMVEELGRRVYADWAAEQRGEAAKCGE